MCSPLADGQQLALDQGLNSELFLHEATLRFHSFSEAHSISSLSGRATVPVLHRLRVFVYWELKMLEHSERPYRVRANKQDQTSLDIHQKFLSNASGLDTVNVVLLATVH